MKQSVTFISSRINSHVSVHKHFLTSKALSPPNATVIFFRTLKAVNLIATMLALHQRSTFPWQRNDAVPKIVTWQIICTIAVTWPYSRMHSFLMVSY